MHYYEFAGSAVTQAHLCSVCSLRNDRIQAFESDWSETRKRRYGPIKPKPVVPLEAADIKPIEYQSGPADGPGDWFVTGTESLKCVECGSAVARRLVDDSFKTVFCPSCRTSSLVFDWGERFVQISLERVPEPMGAFLASLQDATNAQDRVMLLICLHELFAALPVPD